MVADHYWATSYALTADNLYYGFDYKRLKQNIFTYPPSISGNIRKILGRVLRYFFYLVVCDIIEKKITFKFPRTSRAYLEMIPTSGEEFIKARQNGKFQDVDFLTSNFTGYNLGLRYNTRYGKWVKAIHVSEKYKDRITELTNAGHGW